MVRIVTDSSVLYTKEEAEKHPKKNMLMKALGCNAFVEPDVSVKGFLRDDIFSSISYFSPHFILRCGVFCCTVSAFKLNWLTRNTNVTKPFKILS
mgnify:CR=1 FL=1